jgi:carboxypeptidase C (cathepsin A)
MKLDRIALSCALALLAASAPALAQKEPAPAAKPDPAVPPPVVSVTHHTGTFGGQRIAYTATAGETYLKDKDGTPTASFVTYAYIKDGPLDPQRPITFLFNGGPGSGSVWLHMGAFGPKRVVIPNAKDDGAPPYPIIDNPDSLLDATDIVFIDPVGTGFSKALGKTDPKSFWGVVPDAKSVAQFIRMWLDDHGRWNSPKFLGGESYGTTRSVAVAHELDKDNNDVAFNGVILLSTVLDFSAASPSKGNELGYVTNLPSMATTAWYHDKVPNKPASVADFAAEARAWALGPYASALLQGNSLPVAQRAQIRTQLARYTGLSETFLENADLRVSPTRFYKELLRDRGLVIGRLDTRYTGKDYDSAGERPDDDPSFLAIDASYTAAINSYVRADLGLKLDNREYVTIGSVNPWDWNVGNGGGRGGYDYSNVAPWLGESLRQNSGLRVFVGQGWYDFATPFFGAEYSLNRTGIPNDGRIQFHYYDAGHMMYVRSEDLAKLSSDIRTFIRAR